MKHLIPAAFRRHQVTIDLVGCGGTGSLLLTELARLDVSLRASGHPEGLHVTVWDPDVVTEANVARTLFGASDIGQLKASCLVTRINTVYGLHWLGLGRKYEHPYWHMGRGGAAPDLVITTTDTLASRAELYLAMRDSSRPPPRYWLDCGNDAETGQVVLGEPDWWGEERERPHRLRTVVDFFPDMLDRAQDEEPEPPSCSLAGALDRQALFINRHCASWAGELLWRLFRDGGLEWHGVFINARSGRVNPIPVETPDPADVERRVQELLAGAKALAGAEA